MSTVKNKNFLKSFCFNLFSLEDHYFSGCGFCKIPSRVIVRIAQKRRELLNRIHANRSLSLCKTTLLPNGTTVWTNFHFSLLLFLWSYFPHIGFPNFLIRIRLRRQVLAHSLSKFLFAFNIQPMVLLV
jgi:hypothetical protein